MSRIEISSRRVSQKPFQSASYVPYMVLFVFVLWTFGAMISWRSISVAQQSALPLDRDLISIPSLCAISTDVRGNLGSASVMLQNGTDWLRDRWQAASDMGGTAIQGSHWVQLDFVKSIKVRRIVLDWEAAYADHYKIQIPSSAAKLRGTAVEWTSIFTSPNPLIQVTQYGQSPGVKQPMPLHIVHRFSLQAQTQQLRLWIERPARGWGVSLWQIQVYGTIGRTLEYPLYSMFI